VGILFGFVYSFIALWLNKASMPVSWFFTPYAAVALFSAFVIMCFARSMLPATVVATAFAAMAIALDPCIRRCARQRRRFRHPICARLHRVLAYNCCLGRPDLRPS